MGESKELLRTRVFNVLTRHDTAENGVEGDYIALDAPDCVVIIPEYEGNFVLVRQFRHGSGGLTTEFPGGVIDKGEDPLTAAERELYEETGYKAGKLKLIGALSPNPALFMSRFYCFLATELVPTGSQHLDKDELIEIELRPIGDIIREFGSSELSHAFMGAALMFYMREKH